MHTATYLNRSSIRAELDSKPVPLDVVFPGWTAHDRFGIVVDSAYGVVGASLLIQVAAYLFYEVRPRRRDAIKHYPELYAFVLEQPVGDLSMLDFYPRRHEVIVPRNADALIGAVNDRAITRLAVID